MVELPLKDKPLSTTTFKKFLNFSVKLLTLKDLTTKLTKFKSCMSTPMT